MSVTSSQEASAGSVETEEGSRAIVRAALAQRACGPRDPEMLRLVRLVERLRPAAMAACASSPAAGTGDADVDTVDGYQRGFLRALQGLAV